MKKRLLALLLIAAVTLPVVGCKKPAPVNTDNSTKQETTAKTETPESEETAEAEDEELSDGFIQPIVYSKSYFETDEETSDLLIDGCIQTVQISEESQETYPELAKALKELSEGEEKTKDEEFEENLLDARRSHAELAENYLAEKDETHVFIRRADSKVFSYLNEHYSYLGGAHGSTMYGGMNFDPKTGKEIQYSDIVKDSDKLQKALAETIKNDFPDLLLDGIGADYEENMKIYFENGYSPAFTIDNEGVTFYFGSYGLGSYAAGNQFVTLPYSKYADLFSEDILPEKEGGYIMEIPRFNSTFADVDNDGDTEAISVNTTVHYDGDPAAYDPDTIDEYHVDIYVVVDGEQYLIKDEYEVFGTDCRLVKTEGKNTFLLLSHATMNDYTFTNIIKLDGKNKPKLVDTVWYEMPWIQRDPENEEEEFIYGSLTPVDPSAMLLTERFDRTATLHAQNVFKLTEDGKLEAQNDEFISIGYLYGNPIEINVIRDFEGTSIDNYGNTLEKNFKVEKGEKLFIYRTGETELEGENTVYVDFLTEDNIILRVYYDETVFPHTINGTDEDQLIENLLYAG
ncbi:MAG: DUF3298 domain-containing protein [Lachnospiraceae bacterium]|nr:DUF3298 domain-containing protein [Lachnospiraceae bacterium]